MWVIVYQSLKQGHWRAWEKTYAESENATRDSAHLSVRFKWHSYFTRYVSTPVS